MKRTLIFPTLVLCFTCIACPPDTRFRVVDGNEKRPTRGVFEMEWYFDSSLLDSSISPEGAVESVEGEWRALLPPNLSLAPGRAGETGTVTLVDSSSFDEVHLIATTQTEVTIEAFGSDDTHEARITQQRLPQLTRGSSKFSLDFGILLQAVQAGAPLPTKAIIAFPFSRSPSGAPRPSGDSPAVLPLEDFVFDIPSSFTFNDDPNFRLRQNLLLLFSTVVLPHIPVGVLGDLQIGTEIVITNPHPFEVDGQVNFLGAGSGQPVAVTIGDKSDSVHSFSLPAGKSLRLPVRSEAEVEVAWAYVYGDRLLGVSSVFNTRRGTPPSGEQGSQSIGEFVGEAGIAATGVSTRHVVNVLKNSDGVNTSFAIANPTSETATMTLTLEEDSEGVQAAGNQVAEKELVLESRTQTAQFFDDFFELVREDFSGTLRISSDSAVSVISIRTLNFIQTSSLASGSGGS